MAWNEPQGEVRRIKSLWSEVLTLLKDEDLDDEIEQTDFYKEWIYSTPISIERATKPASSLPITSTAPRLPSGLRPLQVEEAQWTAASTETHTRYSM